MAASKHSKPAAAAVPSNDAIREVIGGAVDRIVIELDRATAVAQSVADLHAEETDDDRQRTFTLARIIEDSIAKARELALTLP